MPTGVVDESALPVAITLFSPLHFAVVAAMLVIGAAFVYFPIVFRGEAVTRNTMYALIGVLLVNDWANRFGYQWFYGQVWAEALPFHLCGVAAYGVPAVLLWRNQRIFDVMYFWGLGGASMAFLTPTVRFPVDHPLFYPYFLSHGFIIVGIIYAMVHYGLRPNLRSLSRTFVFSSCYLVAMIGLNSVLGTNYLFAREPPPGQTLFNVLGPWPWYIIGALAVGTVFCFLLGSPWLVPELFRNARKRLDFAARNRASGVRPPVPGANEQKS